MSVGKVAQYLFFFNYRSSEV